MGLAKQSINGVLTGFLLLICSISALHLVLSDDANALLSLK
ncbi:unnamed protein product [Rhodiola kirilowii]